MGLHQENVIFRRFCRLPYDDWSSLDHARMSYVMRFESLSRDFDNVLRSIGTEPVRTLPVASKTRERADDSWSYYTPAIQSRARWVFGLYFRRRGYEVPDDWNATSLPGNEVTFTLLNLPRQLYWRYLR